MATLDLQAYGVDGQAVTTQAADASGDVVQNLGFVLLKLDNSASTGSVDVTLLAARADSQGFARNYTYPVPAGGVRWIPAGKRDRFGNRLSIEYPGGIGDGPLEIGAARVGTLDGLGDNLPQAPALGASPVSVPVISYSGGVDFNGNAVAASVDGNLMLNDQRTEPWVRNASGDQIRVWFRAIPSSHAFRNHHWIDIEDGQTLVGLTMPYKRFGGLVGITYSDVNDVTLGDVTGIEVLGVRNASF